MRVFYFYYSPFLGVPDFNESDVYYHGATAVAIEAEILNSTAQVKQVLARMRRNVALACAPATNCSAATIGLTLWPRACEICPYLCSCSSHQYEYPTVGHMSAIWGLFPYNQ